MTKARATFSIFRYLSSGPNSTLLMKYMGCCCQDSSRTSTPTMAALLTDKYKNSGFSTSSLLEIGGQERYCLKSENAASHSNVHSKVFPFFRKEKMGMAFRADAAMNLEREAILPVRHCTSFTIVGLFISRIAQHLSGFASIPQFMSINPRNFPASTANAHLYGFSLMLCC